MSKKNKKPVFQPVTIPKGDSAVEVGKYCDELKVFSYTLERGKDYRRVKPRGWALDSSVLDFLVGRNALIKLHDKELKWDYEVKATDFKYYCETFKGDYEGAREISVLALEHWEVTKIRNMPQVFRCYREDCTYNFNNICTRGVISINKEGECGGYEL